MGIDIYGALASSPCRAVLLTAKAIGLEFNLKEINLMKKQQMEPEYIKMNPQHTIPTLVDRGFIVYESRAIMQYLANQYGSDSLYPKDPKKRALVDQRMYFDMGTLYQRFGEYVYPTVIYGLPINVEKKKPVEEALMWCDDFLKKSRYVAGDNLTIADLSITATTATIEATEEFDLSKYPDLNGWLSRMKNELPGYQDMNQKGAQGFGMWVKHAFASNK